MSKTRFALFGTGGMANSHANDLRARAERCEIVAACDIDGPKLAEFCKNFEVPHAYPDADALLAGVGGEIDAVLNVTPDRLHHSLSLKAIRAGKHILCEKPLAENYPDAAEMHAEAAKAGVIDMVNFSYRNAAAIQTAHHLVREGAIGVVRHVEASYLQSWLSSKVWGDWRELSHWLWRLSSAHGSRGVLGDIGVHVLDFASFPVGPIARVHCLLKNFPKAEGNRVGEYELDANDSAMITAEFECGALGTIHCTRWATGHANSLRLCIYGDGGAIEIDLDRSCHEIRICAGQHVDHAEWESLACEHTPKILDRFITAVQTDVRVDAQPNFAQGAAIQKVLDACFLSHETQTWIEIQ